MSSSSFSRDEIRAAAETHRELGPEYETAVIDSFLDKVGREIDARVDARLAAPRQMQPMQQVPGQYPQQVPQARHNRSYSPLPLAITSMALGIPLTAITVTAGSSPAGLPGLLVVWLAITAINLAYAFYLRPPSGR